MNARTLALVTPAFLAAAAHAQYALTPASGPPAVQVGTPQGTVTFYVDGLATGLNLAMGDTDGDGRVDIIVGAGPGSTGHVKVFRGSDRALVRTLAPFGNTYTGATSVAAGTLLLGGPTPSIIVSADHAPEDGGSHVRLYDGSSDTPLAAISPFPGFQGGVHIAAADLDGDGLDEILAVPDHTHQDPSIKVFSGRTLLEVQSITIAGNIPPGGHGEDVLIAGVTAYDREGHHTGGILVCMGDGSVRMLMGNNQDVWRPFGPSYSGGVSIAVGDINGDGRAEVIAGMLEGGSVAFLDAQTGQPTAPTIQPFGAAFLGGVYVAAAPPSRCPSADFNHDGDTGTDQDLEAFFACLAGDCCATCPNSADFNHDGDTGTDADIESFFSVLAGGPC